MSYSRYQGSAFYLDTSTLIILSRKLLVHDRCFSLEKNIDVMDFVNEDDIATADIRGCKNLNLHYKKLNIERDLFYCTNS